MDANATPTKKKRAPAARKTKVKKEKEAVEEEDEDEEKGGDVGAVKVEDGSKDIKKEAANAADGVDTLMC